MAENPRVGVVVQNLFMRVPVIAAVRASGAQFIDLSNLGSAAAAACAVVIADLDALGPDPGGAIRVAAAGGATVLAYAPHVRAELLATARAAGAVALPRSLLLQRLPDLLATLLGRGADG